MVKISKIGRYGPKTRSLQKRLAYEKVSHTKKFANVYKYLGSRASEDPQINDIQTTTFMEVPDRAYSQKPIKINIYFEPLQEQKADFSKYGIIDPIGDKQVVKVHVNSYEDLGRELVEGDVLEVPFFEQDHKAFWEVTDVDRSQEFEKFYAIISMNELADSRTTREIDVGAGSIADVLNDVGEQQQKESEDFVPHDGVDDVDVDNDETNDRIGKEKEQRRSRPKQPSFLDDVNGEFVE